MRKIVRFHRGPVAGFFELLFYLFNLGMLAAVVLLVAQSGDILAAAQTEFARGLAGFGAATKAMVLLLLWMAGDVILGSLTIVSRRRTGVIDE